MAQSDVLICGAGAAGMVAALAAAARGRRVALLDPAPEEPSNLAISGGLFAAAGTRWQRAIGISDGPARFAADVRTKTGGSADPVVTAAVTRHSGRVAEFLADVAGLPVHLHTAGTWPGHSVPRLHATPAESGAELSALLRAAVSRDARIERRDGEALVGLAPGMVEVSANGTRHHRQVRKVILATGGFGAAPDLLTQFCPAAAGAVHVGGGRSDGMALRLGIALGAAIACTDAYQGQPHVSPYLIEGQRPRFGASLPALGAIMVNRRGLRFAAEDMGPSELAGHVLAQPVGRAFEIWGEAAQTAAIGGGPFRHAVELGAVRRFDTASSLAAAFGLPDRTFAATLDHVTACFAGQAEDPFGRHNWGTPPTPPFFAAEITGGLAHTQGGLLVDDRARALRPDGTPIPWLFAAGGAACGISGHGATGYVPGNGLAQSFTLGLLAGEAAAS
ncbi:FAD-dependent oxidoreductase [Muricoccus radiodurans]|uniref:FAD-dependent oxidoreductase n=1 Tax=Muricoccus radiodurans TaxID=2231721 RepID=UPI003CEB0740